MQTTQERTFDDVLDRVEKLMHRLEPGEHETDQVNELMRMKLKQGKISGINQRRLSLKYMPTHRA